MGCQGGENGMLSGKVAKHGLPRGGKILIKGMLYLNLNHRKHELPGGGGNF